MTFINNPPSGYNPYIRLSPEEALEQASLNRLNLHGLSDIPRGEPWSIIKAIDNAVGNRARIGFDVDPTMQEEVDGLVTSATGDYSHLPSVITPGIAYVVGLVQLAPEVRLVLCSNSVVPEAME